jgi:hypothetical protein
MESMLLSHRLQDTTRSALQQEVCMACAGPCTLSQTCCCFHNAIIAVMMTRNTNQASPLSTIIQVRPDIRSEAHLDCLSETVGE